MHDFGNNAHIFLTKAVPLSDLRELTKPSVEMVRAAGLLGVTDGDHHPLDVLADAEPAVMVHALADVTRHGGAFEVANDAYDAYFAEVHGIDGPLPPDVVVDRMLRCHGLRGYSLLGRNCEHFASWVRYGHAKSLQADDAKTGAVRGGAAAVGAIVGGAAAVAVGGGAAVAATVAISGGAAVGALAVAAGAEAVKQGKRRKGRSIIPSTVLYSTAAGGLYREVQEEEEEEEEEEGGGGGGGGGDEGPSGATGGGSDKIESEWEARQALASLRENRL